MRIKLGFTQTILKIKGTILDLSPLIILALTLTFIWYLWPSEGMYPLCLECSDDMEANLFFYYEIETARKDKIAQLLAGALGGISLCVAFWRSKLFEKQLIENELRHNYTEIHAKIEKVLERYYERSELPFNDSPSSKCKLDQFLLHPGNHSTHFYFYDESVVFQDVEILKELINYLAPGNGVQSSPLFNYYKKYLIQARNILDFYSANKRLIETAAEYWISTVNNISDDEVFFNVLRNDGVERLRKVLSGKDPEIEVKIARSGLTILEMLAEFDKKYLEIIKQYEAQS